MFVQLDKSQYYRLTDICSSIPFPLINSVIQGIQAGTIYEDVIQKSQICFVLHQSGFGYIYDPEKKIEEDYLIRFFNSEKSLPPYFHLYDAPQNYIKLTDKIEYDLRVRIRIALEYKSLFKPSNHLSLPSGFKVEEINSHNISKLLTANLINHKFWGSEARLLQLGIGSCVMDGDGNAVSVCYAAAIAEGLAEVDITTVEKSRNQGFAKLAVSSYINMCIDKQLKANWDCFEDNIGSLQTAISFGFEEKRKYNFLSFYKKS